MSKENFWWNDKVSGDFPAWVCGKMEFGFHRHGSPKKNRHTKNKEKENDDAIAYDKVWIIKSC